MNILVCVSCVPDALSKISFSLNKKELNTKNIQWIINPLDEYILTKAIQLKQALNAKVSAINVGTIDVENTLKKALAMGADEVIRIDTIPKDSFSTAQEIADIAKKTPFDLILTSNESIDYQNGITPSLLAQILNIPYINACIHLEIKENEVFLTRESNGYIEKLKAKLPLVISGTKGIIEEKDLILPNIRNMMMAKNKSIDVRTSASHQPKINYSFENKPQRENVKMISPQHLDELIEVLKNKNII